MTIHGTTFSAHDYLNDWWEKNGFSSKSGYRIDLDKIDCGTKEEDWIRMATRLIQYGVLDSPQKIRAFIMRAKLRCMQGQQEENPEEPIYIGEAIVHREEKPAVIAMPEHL